MRTRYGDFERILDVGSLDFRKQNQALGQDGTWRSEGTAPKEFWKAEDV